MGWDDAAAFHWEYVSQGTPCPFRINVRPVGRGLDRREIIAVVAGRTRSDAEAAAEAVCQARISRGTVSKPPAWETLSRHWSPGAVC